VKGDHKTYHASIDGKKVKVRNSQTILDAIRKAGIYIPTLCHLQNLEPYGGCRLCAVEVQGMKGYPTACTTPLRPGMEILTRTPELQKLRRNILEFILAEHPYTCLVCKDKKDCTDFMHTTRKVSTVTGCNFCTSNGDCELQKLVEFLELDDVKFPISYRGISPVRDNPFYDLDYNLCVLCGRCVRICNEERNSHVLAFVERGNNTIVGTAFGENQLEAGCEFCGACVDVCPTGSISEKIGKWRGIPERSVQTTCVICPVACDMNVNTRRGKLVQIGPEPDKRSEPFQLCLRGKFLPADMNDHPHRITTPLIKKSHNRWVEVSWKEAFEYTARKLESYKGSRFGTIASGQDTLEDNYLVQKFTRKVMKSNNVDLHASYPGKDTPELLQRFHMMHPPAGLKDIEKADAILLLGLDASVSHPLLENRIRKAFRSGRNIIYSAPFITRSSTFATRELRYQPGEEAGFLVALQSAIDKGNSSGATEQNPDLEPALSLLLDSKKLVIIAGDDLLRQSSAKKIMGGLFHLHALLSRNRQCHIIFPSYEGNLCGSALAGVHPWYLPGFKPVKDEKNIRKWNRTWETKLSGEAGLSCNEMILQTGKEGMEAMMLIGDLNAHPGLANLELLVHCNMFRTDVTEFADVFLPVTDFLETEGHILSLDGRLKKLNQAVSRPGHVKTIAGIISGLAKVMGESGFSSNPHLIFKELRSISNIPGRAGMYMSTEEVKSGTSKTDFPNTGAQDSPPEIPEEDNSYPVKMMLRHNHFRYRGNRLNDLVPDLESITGNGSIGLPASMMEEHALKEGNRVMIVSRYGKIDSVAISLPGLIGQSACLFTSGKESFGLYEGVYPEEILIDVKIEKV